MAINSNINPNFPLPGIDQSSRGFRDNFSYAKTEIENLQGKQIQLTGDCVSEPILIDSGTGALSINTRVLFHSLTVSGNQHGVLYNDSGIITTSVVYYDPPTQNLGIGTTLPRDSLDIYSGNLVLGSESMNQAMIMTQTETDLVLGANSTPLLVLSAAGMVGIGTAPDRTFDVEGGEYDIARFTSTLGSTDVGVRVRTNIATSVSWIVENNGHTGGIRSDAAGFVSLHAGESAVSGLQDGGSRALTIDPISKFVGIGTATPSVALDVNGNFHVSGTITVGAGAPTLLGSRGGNAALANLITLLAASGLIVDGTSA